MNEENIINILDKVINLLSPIEYISNYDPLLRQWYDDPLPKPDKDEVLEELKLLREELENV